MLAHRLRRASQKDTGPVGQVAYTTTGTYSWVCPAGVTSVCVVCVGPGGDHNNTASVTDGAGGGGLGWKNNIPVTPGTTYSVQVGAKGTLVYYPPIKAGGSGSYGYVGGTDSFFISATTVKGENGDTGPGTAGGGFVGDGGGNGGAGVASANYKGSGGGGAGGYTGNGGDGSRYTTSPVSVNVSGIPGGAGSGGGGGGGSGSINYSTNQRNGGRGGGVGIMGQGANGAGGAAAWGDSVNGNNGGHGSGGTYGAGAAGGYAGFPADSTGGAVRIIWGAGRAFPSTRTGDEP